MTNWNRWLYLLLFNAALARAQTSPPHPAIIHVDAGSSLGPVNPLVFGQNIEAGDPTGIFGIDKGDPNMLRSAGGLWDPVKREPVADAVNVLREGGTRMIRYPGGCLAHNFDWKRTVGPISERGDWLFGLDEFMTVCHRLGVEPMITVSDYVLPAAEMPQHAADLVEYLNGPADGHHPWADMRKLWGHPEAYGVTFFELGNESDHGNHQMSPSRKFSPEEYSTYALKSAAAMKAVDPKIKVGIVTVPGSQQDAACAWNETVIRLAGPAADFVIVHIYAPYLYPGYKTDAEAALLQGCMAISEQMEVHLQQFHELIRERTGHDLPLAITEFNAGFFGDAPKAYRFSFAAALETADLLRVFLDPKQNILSANYWQILNGWWGMVDLRKPAQSQGRPAFALYRLWAQHFGMRLIAVRSEGPKQGFAGGNGVDRAEGNAVVASVSVKPVNVLERVDIKTLAAPNVAFARAPDGGLALMLHNFTDQAYPHLLTVPRDGSTRHGTVYRIAYTARYTPAVETPADSVATLGLGLSDLRGWAATRSALDASRTLSPEWRTITADFESLVDAPGIDIVIRLESKNHVLNGVLGFKDITIIEKPSMQYAAYNLLTSIASLSGDGETLYVVAFNKSVTTPLDTTVQLENFPAVSASRWTVGADAFTSFEAGETIHVGGIPVYASRIQLQLPAHSMTALEFKRMKTR